MNFEIIENDLLKFKDMSREEFLGRPRIVSSAHSKNLVPKVLTTLKGLPHVQFINDLTAVYNKDGAAVFDGNNVIASYNFGDTLVVDKRYRRQGIGEELIYQWRKRFPNANTAQTRTKISQKMQNNVWNRIQKELLDESFLYPPGSNIPGITDYRDPAKSKKYFQPYTKEDIETLTKLNIKIRTYKGVPGRWLNPGRTHIVLTKNNGVIVFNYGSNDNIIDWRELLSIVNETIDRTIQPVYSGLIPFKNGYMISRNRDDLKSWIGDINKYSEDISKISNELINRGLANKNTPIWIGNVYKGSGEYIGRIGSIQSSNNIPNYLKLYHGTSNYRLQHILKYGLRPIELKDRVWNKGGLEKMRPEHRDDSVYLTASKPQAEYYAKKATDTDRNRYNVTYRRNINNKINLLEIERTKLEWYIDHGKQSPEIYQKFEECKEKLSRLKETIFYGPFEEVILQITIPKSKYDKLMADDDYLRTVKDAKPTDGLKSLSYFGQVAFRGNIPPSQIKVIAQGKEAKRISD